MRAGDSKDVAARKVFRRVRQFDLELFGYKAKSDKKKSDVAGVTQDTIAGWRDKFTGHGNSSIGAERFRIILGYEIVKNQSPRSAATWILESLLGTSLPKIGITPPT